MDFSKLRFINDTWVLILPLFLMAMDIVTGYLSAWKDKDIRSGKMRSGLIKKTGELIEIIIVEILGASVGLPPEIVQWISAYICLTEGVSIVENMDKMGVPMPGWIKNRINGALAKADGEKDGSNN